MEPMHEVSQRCGLQLENADEPFEIFGKWMDDAKHSELNDPNAMSLATATPEGFPSVRIVLCKGFGPEGFKFYTNAESRKGEELLFSSPASHEPDRRMGLAAKPPAR
jgi:pyridoxamine 5'-phosphate oxidase